MHLVTFSNLFPSSVMPTHGLFVYERMRRVAAAAGDGIRWSVIAPVPKVIWPLRRGLHRDWHRVPERESWNGVDVHHPRFKHWPGLSMHRQAKAVADGARDLVRSLAREDQVVLDAHYLWPDGVAASMLAAEFELPFTMTARGSDANVLGQDPQIGSHIGAAAKRAHACMAVSDALAETYAKLAGLPRSGVQTVRNGVDLERFAPGDVAAARHELGLPTDRKLVLLVSRLVGGKGLEVAARAVRQLPDAQLVLAGDGPERDRVAAVGRDRVTFLGTLPPERVAIAYRAADVFTLPSEREGWPNVVTEALASGLPVVATRVGGIPQILGGDPPAAEIGELVDVGDAEQLAAALQRCLDRGERRAVVRRFAERYGWQEPIATLLATFRAAVPEGVR